MIHFKGIGEHSVFELEKIILEQNELLYEKQLKIQLLEKSKNTHICFDNCVNTSPGWYKCNICGYEWCM